MTETVTELPFIDRDDVRLPKWLRRMAARDQTPRGKEPTWPKDFPTYSGSGGIARADFDFQAYLYKRVRTLAARQGRVVTDADVERIVAGIHSLTDPIDFGAAPSTEAIDLDVHAADLVVPEGGFGSHMDVNRVHDAEQERERAAVVRRAIEGRRP